MKKTINILGILILSSFAILIIIYQNSRQPTGFSPILLIGIPIILATAVSSVFNTLNPPSLPTEHLRLHEKVIYESSLTRYMRWNGVGAAKSFRGYFTITNQRLIFAAVYLNYHTYKRHIDLEFNEGIGKYHVKKISYNKSWDFLIFEGENWNVKLRVKNPRELEKRLQQYIT